MTKILIATPTFNSEKTIAKTILSIITQHGDFTIDYLVQDGGSGDKTLEICHRYKKLVELGEIDIFCKSVKITIVTEKDNGMYDAIWKAFDTLGGNPDDWMGWINSDDILNPGCFSILAEIDRQHGSKWIKWVGGRTSVVDGSRGLIIGYGDRPHNKYAIEAGLCEGYHWDFIQQEGTFLRRQLWDSFDNQKEFRNYKYAGDWNLWRLIARKAELFQVQWPSGSFHREEGQISGELRFLYEAEINMTLDYRTRTERLTQMSELNATGHAMHTAYATSEVYTKASPQLELLNKWKNKSALRELFISKFYDCEQDQILNGHLQADINDDLFIIKGDSDSADCTSFCFIGYRYHWQYPAITEKHAAEKLIPMLRPFNKQLYIAFPWATLIDMIECGDERRHLLISDLGKLVKLVPRETNRVITSCQHILLYKYHKLLALAGITDVFWSHANTEAGQRLGKLNTYAFPLYPVQHRSANAEIVKTEEEEVVLYSFAGAINTHSTRKLIVDLLGNDNRGSIIGRDSWHFQDLVYGSQINAYDVTRIQPSEAIRVAKNSSTDYSRLMLNSIFAICPPGTGPNTIRLWEAIDYGCIPVLFANSLSLPGSDALWKDAIVLVGNDPDAIKAIPDVLSGIASNLDQIISMRSALGCIRIVYGHDSFVTDVINLWHNGIVQRHELSSLKPIRFEPANQLMSRLNRILELKVPMNQKATTISNMLDVLARRDANEAKRIAEVVYSKWPELQPS